MRLTLFTLAFVLSMTAAQSRAWKDVRHLRGAGLSCPGFSCAAGIMSGQALLGGLIDWQIVRKRTVYKAP